jgi:hypothetical protein
MNIYGLPPHQHSHIYLQWFIITRNKSERKYIKWVPGAWGYNWATLTLGDINTEASSSRMGVGRGANNPTL